MSPENARIFLTEDDSRFRKLVKERLEKAGHEVIFEAADLKTALEGAKQAEDLGINVGVVDGNLTKDDFSGYDGERVATTLRDAVPNIKIVSLSGLQQEYGDVHVDKADLDSLLELGETVAKL